MSTDKFTVLIPTYNNGNELFECIESLKFISKYVKELIIINNGRTDLKYVKKINNPKIRVITNNKNLGFAKAVNIGISATKTKIILLLNPDTLILDKSPIRLFKKINSDNSISIIGGKLISENRKEYYTANGNPNVMTAIFEFTNLKKIFPNNEISSKFWPEKLGIDKATEVYSLCGAFFFFKKFNKNNLNTFNTKYFMYLEDLDFCLTNKKMGYKVIFDPSSAIYHAGGSSSNNKYRVNLKEWYKSRKIFFIESKHKLDNPIARKAIYFLFTLEECLLYIYHHLKHEPHS